MPIYQYQCSDCGHSMEALQKMSDPKLTDCPECGKAALRKQVTAAAFKLKGTGWYETDFKNSGAKPSPKSDASSEASDTSSSSETSAPTTESSTNSTSDTSSAASSTATKTSSASQDSTAS